MPPFFDRPLHRDGLLRVAAVVLLVVATTSALANIDGRTYDPERMAEFVATVLAAAVLAAVLVLLAAAVRWLYRWGAPPAAHSPARPPRPAARPSSWSSGAVWRTDLGMPVLDGQRRSGHRGRHHRPQAPVRPPQLEVRLGDHTTVAGLPVELTWRAPYADWVSVDGGSLLDATGTTWVDVQSTREVVVTAGNACGTTTVRTGLVRVLPVPAIAAVRVPASGPVSLSADIDVSVRAGDGVARRLDAVLADQARLRAAQAPPPPLVVPPSPEVEAAVAALRRGAQALRRPVRPGGAAGVDR